MNNKFVIGLSGKLESGKTTVAKLLWSKFYNKFELINFGDILKTESSTMYNYPIPWNYTHEGKKNLINHEDLPRKDMTVREVLQWHGTDFRRSQDENYWVKKMQDYLDFKQSNVIIDDVRFINEAEFVLNNNGFLFRINIPGLYTGDHRSETELDDYSKFTKVLDTDTNNPYYSWINSEIIYKIVGKELLF